jgi:tetratricopeptide (TPR) repeat protein
MRQLIVLIRALLLLPLLAAIAPVHAAEYTDGAAVDELFAQLKTAQSADDANEIVQQIWAYWLTPDDPELAKRMDMVKTATIAGDLTGAIQTLDGVVKDFPDYAEGWNQRATLYYETGQLDASLADIAKVLAIEPRHFGALSGRVAIYLQQGKRADALKDMVAALAIDPYVSGREMFPELSQNVTHV